jgi:hypothetical protein
MFFSLTFARGCWGDETGEKVDYNAYFPAEDPMKGTGYTRMTSKDDIKNVYGKYFKIISFYQTIRGVSNIDKKIKEWVIECQKK